MGDEATGPRVVGVVQARMGSTRLPGKVLERIGDRPLVLRTVAAMQAVPSIAALVVATTSDPSDDPLVDVLTSAGVSVHRGPVHDVLRRVVEAAVPLDPDFVVRQTADNPFVDPTVVGGQIRQAVEHGLDYVGIAGWPLGIAAEVARWPAVLVADREATTPAEREHVMPFIYSRPKRFRIAGVPGSVRPAGRFTVDTPADLEFARRLAELLEDRLAGRAGEVPVLDDLRSILAADTALAELNERVAQRSWQEAEVG
jgi:spore coat polysaccharide biosynthesis protein SpsF